MWRALGLVALLGAAEIVIPPGREALVLEMLGGGVEMPGGCRLAGANVDRTHVSARYACDAGEVTVALRHPAEAGAGAVIAGEIAVSGGANAPPALIAAVADRVRARGDRWSWVTLEEGAADPGRPKPIAARPHRAVVLAALVVIPLLGVFLRTRLARRR